LLVGLGWWLRGFWPVLQALPIAIRAGSLQELIQNLPLDRVMASSLEWPVLSVLIQLPVAYGAALGISALRPLGRWSEWLLLPFSPWLFVTLGVLAVPAFAGMRATEQIGTAWGLVPRFLVSVPALFALALFFKGRHAHWRAAVAAGQPAAGAFTAQVIVPSLPLAALLALLIFAANWQELLWPTIASPRPDRSTLAVALLTFQRSFGAAPGVLAAGLALLVWPVGVVLWVALAALTAWGERLVAVTGQRPD
jgi:ABC-type glycerol-3-phosphate transport system permease component